MKIKAIFYRALENKIFSLPKSFIKRITLGYLNQKNKEIFQFDSDFFNVFKKIQKETELLMSAYQAFVLFSLAKSSTKMAGDMLEVGVYKGGSAKLICSVKGDKNLYLFDTFEGLKDAKEVDKESSNSFVNGDFKSDYDTVKRLLSKEEGVSIYKGYFPEDAENMTNKKFCFVNLDVDTYESTLNSLKFIYSKMNRGGFILSHDYPTAKGVKTAIDEFFEDKPESIIQVSNKQCLIVKL